MEDTASSRSLRSDIRARISEPDACILDLEKSLAAVRCERETLHSRLDDYTYPFLTLPAEIMSEIFIAFLPDYPECPPMSGLHSPALLGQVCRHWREIAFDTPWLWRAIKLYLWNKYSLEALKAWLSRSKCCSLSLSLRKSDTRTFSDLSPFTDVLISHAARWEYVQLMLPYEQEYHWIEAPFPLLRHLTIAPTTYGTEGGPKRLFGDTPQLESVVFGSLSNSPPLVLPWSQLTIIDAEMVTPIAAVAILQQARALIGFCCTLWDDVIVPGAVPPLLHLQSLIICDVDGLGDNLFQDPQRLLLNALITPALRHLSFSERELGIEPISTITSLLSRSHCSLDSLHVTRSSLPEADYRVAFPSIKAIELSMDDSDDER
ncbi:hypothetical protein C8J57DRAFT_1074686 [Mycena rebaudengoi]|nr:hypothetical protein C8J57DRAFT_1074686 [Mycena rebaudengoi]